LIDGWDEQAVADGRDKEIGQMGADRRIWGTMIDGLPDLPWSGGRAVINELEAR
jgi:hypothetical protein